MNKANEKMESDIAIFRDVPECYIQPMAAREKTAECVFPGISSQFAMWTGY